MSDPEDGSHDDFYIGWSARAAPVPARVARRTVMLLLALVLAVAATTAVSQRMIGTGTWDWRTERTFEGRFIATPVPHLLSTGSGGFHLVAPWKFGLSPATARQYDGKVVRLRGTLIQLGDEKMIEVSDGSIALVDGPESTAPPPPVPEDSGVLVLTGEIVDSKCFLGVMNPGNLKTHRACAIRCISGGVPPLLVVRKPDGTALSFHLAGPNGEPVNDQILDLIAEPVRVRGAVERHGSILVLKTAPDTIVRLDYER